MTVQENSPAKCSDAVLAASREWPLIDALLGGTAAMRKMGEKFLPKRALEEQKDYDNRLSKATLFNAFGETVATLTGRVFADPLKIGDDVPKWIQEDVIPDFDRQGNSMHVFGAEVLTIAMAYGLSFVLVDAPNKAASTLKEQKEQNLKPYAIHIRPENVLGWRVKDGKLTQVRIRFWRDEDSGEFDVKKIEQIKVYELRGKVTLIRVFEKDAKNEKWIEQNELGSTIDLDTIPLVPVYTGRSGYFTAIPPLRELAYLNAKHWSAQNDNDTLIETASVPILVAYGIQDAKDIVVGAKVALALPTSGKLAYTEHTGAAIGAGRQALVDLKEEMRQVGAKLLIPQTAGNKTATQVTEESARENSTLGRIVRDFNNAMNLVLKFIAMFRSEEKGGSVEAQPNLDPDFMPNESLKFLMEMANGGRLSDETLFAETQRRGVISSDVKWEDEQVRIREGATQPVKTEPPIEEELDDEGNPIDPTKPKVPPKKEEIEE